MTEESANQTTQLKTWLKEQGVPDHLVLPLLRSHTPEQIRNGIRTSVHYKATPEQAAERVLAGQFGVRPELQHTTRPPDWNRGTRTGGDIPSPVKQQQLNRKDLLERKPDQEVLSKLPQIP